jgi:predicted RNA binding protein YcfA (HicA-like mRNA interferase family)
MSQREKLVERLRQKPKDFTWSEAVKLLEGFGYKEEPGGGSRRKFFNSARNVVIHMHEPHPRKELKSYQIRELLNHLKQEGYL